MPLQLATFLHAHRLAKPTGVGKHIRHTLRLLGEREDVALHLAAPRRQLRNPEVMREMEALGLSAEEIPWRRKPLEIAWRMLDRPRFDRWAGDAEWCYSPAEVYVATRRLKRAVTVHCINWFDPDLPWYGNPATAAERRRMRRLFTLIAERSDVILTVSEYLNERLFSLFGVERERMRVVGNGVEEAYFEAGERGPDAEGEPYLLVVGGLTTRKGGALLTAMAPRLAAAMPELKIKVVGRSEPEHHGASLEHSNIEHLGYVGVESGLVDLMRNARGLLFPSRCETFGIPAVEAMAAGTVPMVSRHAALPGLVGEAGIVVGDDPEAATREVVEALGDPLAMRQRGVMGRELARPFTWERVVDRVVEAMAGG